MSSAGLSSSCDRFEREALLWLQQGKTLDDHFESCPDCLRAAEEHRQLEKVLRLEGDDLRPPDHWQAGVWSAIERRGHRRRQTRRWVTWGLVPLALALILALAKDWILSAPDLPLPVGLEMTLIEGESTLRSLDAAAGDSLRLRALVPDAGDMELRVYRNDRNLVFGCGTDGSSTWVMTSIDGAVQGSCKLKKGVLESQIPMQSRGRYQALWIRGPSGLPKPGAEGLDPDAALLIDAGAEVELSDSITVR